MSEENNDPVNHPGHYCKGGIEDLKKARWYLNRLIGECEKDAGDGIRE